MKKYFMTGTDEEIQFGEMIELDFTKDSKNGVTHHHMECKFIPELVDMLLENDIIEVVDDEEEEENEEMCLRDYLLEFDKTLNDLSEASMDWERRIKTLEEEIKKINLTLHSIISPKKEVKREVKKDAKAGK